LSNVALLPSALIFPGKWIPACRRVNPYADLLGWPLGVREEEIPQLSANSF